MTVAEALKTDKQLILTIDPHDGSERFQATMVRPYCLTHDGTLYGEMQDGVDWIIREEFIVSVELGSEII